MKRLSPSFRILRHVVLMVVALVFLMPFIWMVLTSLKPADEIFGSEIHLFPTRFAAVENYTLALTKVPLLRYLWNGVLVCAGILVLQILVALPAAYAFAKLSFRGNDPPAGRERLHHTPEHLIRSRQLVIHVDHDRQVDGPRRQTGIVFSTQ